MGVVVTLRSLTVVITFVLSLLHVSKLGRCIVVDRHDAAAAEENFQSSSREMLAADGAGAAVAGSALSQQLLSQLKSGNLVPEVVATLPDNLLDMRVLYGDVELPIGVQMRLVQTQNKPSVQFYGNGFGGDADKYTLAMVDPDAPSPSNPVLRNILHWLVTDIPGSTTASQEIWETGQEKIPYMGPAPPEGLHRYVLLLFKQEKSSGLFDKVMEVPPSRVSFSLADFVKKYKLGIPVAGYYFRAAYGN
jgi:phosphatidylethanolamine-binding protein (PEBP) family uncharacterized protein